MKLKVLPAAPEKNEEPTLNLWFKEEKNQVTLVSHLDGGDTRHLAWLSTNNTFTINESALRALGIKVAYY